MGNAYVRRVFEEVRTQRTMGQPLYVLWDGSWCWVLTKKSRLRVWHVWQSDVKQSLSHEHVRTRFLSFKLTLLSTTPISERVLWLPHRTLFSEILTLTYSGCPIVCCVFPAPPQKLYGRRRCPSNVGSVVSIQHLLKNSSDIGVAHLTFQHLLKTLWT